LVAGGDENGSQSRGTPRDRASVDRCRNYSVRRTAGLVAAVRRCAPDAATAATRADRPARGLGVCPGGPAVNGLALSGPSGRSSPGPGDSFLRIYEQDEPTAAGFIAHLARELKQPLASIINDGGASTLVRQELYRRRNLLKNKRLVIWEFVERDIRYGTEGWQVIPLPPKIASRANTATERRASDDSSGRNHEIHERHEKHRRTMDERDSSARHFARHAAPGKALLCSWEG